MIHKTTCNVDLDELMLCLWFQQEFFNCLCSLIDSSSDDDDDGLVDAAKSVVLNGLYPVFHICTSVTSVYFWRHDHSKEDQVNKKS